MGSDRNATQEMTKKKRTLQSAEFVLKKMAERGGFEPPVPINMVRRFSKPLPSATQPSLRVCAQLRSDVAEKDTIGIVFCQGINRSMRGLALESIFFPFSINDVSVGGGLRANIAWVMVRGDGARAGSAGSPHGRWRPTIAPPG